MNLEYIQSKNNPLIKELKKLKEKKYREEKNQFIVEGLRFTEEALKSSFSIECVVINEEFLQREENVLFINQVSSDIRVCSLSKESFKVVCGTENSQGILAVVNNKILNTEKKNGFYIFVDRVQDPGNLGTIIRTAHASGALGVILRKGTVDLYNEKTLRSTMGSIFKVPVVMDKDLSCILSLKEKGFKVISSFLHTDKDFYDLDLKENVIIVVGNEGNGISDEIIELSDTLVKLPMPGDAESLNASIAAAIMMYEIVRQNRFK